MSACEGLPGRRYSADLGGGIDDLFAVANQTKAIKAFSSLASSADDRWMRAHVREDLLSRREVWARAYAQCVAEETGDETLLHEIATRRAGGDAFLPDSQWAVQDDFAPLRDEIRDVFRRLGWLR